MPSSVMALCGQARNSERVMRMVDEPESRWRGDYTVPRRACVLRAGLADAPDRAVPELLRRAPKTDVEVGRQLAERRARQRPVFDHQRVEQLRVLDALRDQ